jgi:hypothetical protein
MLQIPKFMKELLIALFCAPFIIQAAVVMLPNLLGPVIGLILLGLLIALVTAPIVAVFVLWRRLPSKRRLSPQHQARPPRGVKTIKRAGAINRGRTR